MRLPWPAVASGTLVVALGAAGLIRAAVPPSEASSAPSAAGPIVVTGAYVRPPVPPTRIAAAYFTVYNTTGTPDRLRQVATGAGATAVIHSVAPDGSMHVAPNGVVIPAHGSVVLSTGKAHVMIEHLYGTIAPGQTVNIELDFDHAGSIDVAAPVVALGAPVPGDSHSGAHS